MRSVGKFRVARADIYHCDQLAARAEDRCPAAAQCGVSRPEMLRAMNRDRALFGDAGPYAVGAFDPLRPDAALPDSPVLEVSDSARIAANVDDDAVRRGEQQGIPDLADDGVQAIVVLAREPDELLDRRPADA